MSKQIVVMVFYSSAPAETVIIDDTLCAMQAIVGGYIEAVEHRGYTMWCNEDALSLGLPFNRWVGDHAIHGVFFVTRSTISEHTEGLRAEDIPKVRSIFARKAVA